MPNKNTSFQHAVRLRDEGIKTAETYMYTFIKPKIDLSGYHRDVSGKYLAREDIEKAIMLVSYYGSTLKVVKDREDNEMLEMSIYSTDCKKKIVITAYDYKELKQKIREAARNW